MRHNWTAGLVCFLFVLGWCSPQAVSTAREAQESEHVKRLLARGFVTFWSHDATGYHPSVLFKLENIAGRDLTGTMIKFQAKFLDVRDAHVMVGRKEIRQQLKNHQQIYILLRGPEGYELPMDSALWPTIECKVMCRVGSVGDEGTQTLFDARIDTTTEVMSEEDAFSQLSKTADFSPTAMVPPPAEHQRIPDKPLKATAGTLKRTTPAEPASITATRFLTKTPLPGLGDDFYDFERAYDEPRETDTKDPNWTWACYQKKHPQLTIYVGSKGRSGKADLVLVPLPAVETQNQALLVDVARALSGKAKITPQVTHPSVRYLPCGTVHLLSGAGKGLRFVAVTPKSQNVKDKPTILAVSRLPGNLEQFLMDNMGRVRMLKPMAPFFGSD